MDESPPVSFFAPGGSSSSNVFAAPSMAGTFGGFNVVNGTNALDFKSGTHSGQQPAGGPAPGTLFTHQVSLPQAQV